MEKKRLIICTFFVVLFSIILTGCNKELSQQDSRNRKNNTLTEEKNSDTEADNNRNNDIKGDSNSSNSVSSSILQNLREKPEEPPKNENETEPGDGNIEDQREALISRDLGDDDKDQSNESTLTDIWSEPNLVDNWSDPNSVNNWSDPNLTEQWSNNLQADNSSNPVMLDIELKDYYGTWKLWIPGGMTDYYDTSTGDYTTSVYTPGAGAGTLKINKDGTYTFDHIVWGNGVIKGKWHEAEAGEFLTEQAIILSNGPSDTDWAVQPTSEEAFNLLYYWKDIDSWFFDSKISKQ
jgi:hypothetical protein